MEKTIYRESRRVQREYLSSVYNEEAIKKTMLRQLVWNIFQNIELEDLEKLGFEMETIDPMSDESYLKFTDPQTPKEERAFLQQLFNDNTIELRVKLLL